MYWNYIQCGVFNTPQNIWNLFGVYFRVGSYSSYRNHDMVEISVAKRLILYMFRKMLHYFWISIIFRMLIGIGKASRRSFYLFKWSFSMDLTKLNWTQRYETFPVVGLAIAVCNGFRRQWLASVFMTLNYQHWYRCSDMHSYICCSVCWFWMYASNTKSPKCVYFILKLTTSSWKSESVFHSSTRIINK